MLHASDPLDVIVVSGDMTDAGRSTEWAEFLDAVSRHPNLAGTCRPCGGWLALLWIVAVSVLMLAGTVGRLGPATRT